MLMHAAPRGSVDFLVVLYSINVFITFSLSQLGMVRHWWQERAERAGLAQTNSPSTAWASSLTTFILVIADCVQVHRGRLDHAGRDRACWWPWRC